MLPEQRPLRVAMVTPRFFPLAGGIETHVYEVARRMTGTGIEVTVLTTDTGGTLPPREQIDGIQVRRFAARPAERDYYFSPRLYKAIAQGGWDVVHCQGIHTLVPPMAMLAAKRAGIPFVVTFHTGGHSSRLRHTLRRAQWLALRPLLASAARLIGVSHFEADLFRTTLRLPRRRFVVIPNGGRLPPATAAGTPGDGALVVSIGRLEQYKGHQRAIAALPTLRGRCPSARLLILGSGPYEGALRALAQRLGVAAYVEIRSVPASDRQGMANILGSAAVVVLLSEYEAHPVSVMEALVLRRPVLVADTSGLSELAERRLVTAVPLNSTPETVARAMLKQLETPLVPPAVTLPTWDDCAEALVATYRDIARREFCCP